MDETIERYLNENASLKRAVGIDEHAELRPRHLGQGEHNLNYRFDDPATGRAFVLRVNVASQPFHENQVAYEFGALRALAPCGRTPQPLYLDDGPEAPGKGAMVISFCEGRQLDFDNLKPGDLENAIQLMADVHAVPIENNCSIHRPTDPLGELFNECAARFELYRTSVFEDARVTKWAERFMRHARRALDEAPPTTTNGRIVNTETLPSHFLLPEKPGSPDADPGYFIDWERPIIGEVAQDVAYFCAPTTTYWDSEFLFPASEVESLVERYWQAVDGRFARDGFDARLGAWQMMTALRSVTWCCKALVTYGSGNEHTTEKTAVKLPIYLSDDFMNMLAANCFDL